MLKKAIIISLSVLMVGCATTYQKNGIFGGYSNSQAPAGYTKVTFNGNGYTSSLKTKQYAMMRIADLGAQRHRRYFSLYQTMTDIALDRKASTPAVTILFDKPQATAYVKFSNRRSPGDFSVAEIHQKFKNLYHS